MRKAKPTCLRLLVQLIRVALAGLLVVDGNNITKSIAMTATTTSKSTSVNPFVCNFCFISLFGYGIARRLVAMLVWMSAVRKRRTPEALTEPSANARLPCEICRSYCHPTGALLHNRNNPGLGDTPATLKWSSPEIIQLG